MSKLHTKKNSNELPFESRYKKYRILNYGLPYTNYKTYNVKHNPNNDTNIYCIYVDNQTCNHMPTNKSLEKIDENKELILDFSNKTINKYFVEIHFTPEQSKPKLEYIMIKQDINELLTKYGYVMDN